MSGTDLAYGAICCYAMSVTDIEYCDTYDYGCAMRCPLRAIPCPVLMPACCAMSVTALAHAATHQLY
eukprot:3834542-Rhodomonas_salina.5